MPSLYPIKLLRRQRQKPQADEAKFALLRQIEGMRRAEQIQRQQHLEYQRVQLASQPLSREEKLEQWRQQGMTDKEADFLRRHETMIDFPQVAALAANEALAAGIEKDSSLLASD